MNTQDQKKTVVLNQTGISLEKSFESLSLMLAMKDGDEDPSYPEQVAEYLKSLEGVKFDEICLVGRGSTSALVLAGMEQIFGLPTVMTLTSFGRDSKRIGTFNLDNFRHNIVRTEREKRVAGEEWSGFIVINGGHPMKDFQIQEMAELLKVGVETIRILDANMGNIDPSNPSTGIVDKLLSLPITLEDWEGGKIIYNPATFGPLSAIQSSAIYALSGKWPFVVRLVDKGAEGFHVKEILDIQSFRKIGKKLAEEWSNKLAPVMLQRNLLNEILESNDIEEIKEKLRKAAGIATDPA